MAYVHLVSNNRNIKVKNTDELEENSDLNLDFDASGKVIGIEFFGFTALKFRDMNNVKKIYTKNQSDKGIIYSFRLADIKPKKSVQVNGLVLYFKGEEFEDFVGLDITDVNLYGREILDSLTI
ncbi:Protein of unknown function [Marininema mesophilum]|uniref:DUF2283 domain-containing protein n=1 Tax=Marininema mesophilum TaxID=1048340 RepID=A0A1H3A481_9BACL|nr:Protein of unknown function [Marininema mesophilum]